MRVISGEYKGRKLEAPLDRTVRPTSDKVKEAIFDIIMNDVYGNTFLDLFAGSGALGIEALSRGAKKCYFCDKERTSIALVKKNIGIVGAYDKAIVLHADHLKALSRINDKIDVVIMDPPYDSDVITEALNEIVRLDLLSDDGIIIIEHDIRNAMPEETLSFEMIKQKKYGKTGITIYKKQG